MTARRRFYGFNNNRSSWVKSFEAIADDSLIANTFAKFVLHVLIQFARELIKNEQRQLYIVSIVSNHSAAQFVNYFAVWSYAAARCAQTIEIASWKDRDRLLISDIWPFRWLLRMSTTSDRNSVEVGVLENVDHFRTQYLVKCLYILRKHPYT